MNSPTVARSAACRWDLSLNCVIRPASPNPVRQPSTQASRACSGTWDCTKSTLRSASTPAARYCAAVTLVRWRSTAGSCSTVIACRSTMQYTQSWVSCSATHWRSAPR